MKLFHIILAIATVVLFVREQKAGASAEADGRIATLAYSSDAELAEHSSFRHRERQLSVPFAPGLDQLTPIATDAVDSRQISGTEPCACSPRVYELTFDFSLECEPINVDLTSGGIVDATCLVAGFENVNVTDLAPVSVSSIQLIEIGQDGGPAAVAQETGDFRDGDTVTYTSISFEGGVAPRAFQLRALGRNSGGEPLVLQWSLTYSNHCGIFFPILEVNDSVGWTIFTGLARPLALVCPAAVIDEASQAPSSLPSLQPSQAPSSQPSVQPSVSAVPSGRPSQIPSSRPSVQPSLSAAPSGSPSSQPSTSDDDEEDCLLDRIRDFLDQFF